MRLCAHRTALIPSTAVVSTSRTTTNCGCTSKRQPRPLRKIDPRRWRTTLLITAVSRRRMETILNEWGSKDYCRCTSIREFLLPEGEGEDKILWQTTITLP